MSSISSIEIAYKHMRVCSCKLILIYISYIGTPKFPQKKDRESPGTSKAPERNLRGFFEENHNYSVRNRRHQVATSSDEEETSENTLTTEKPRQSEKKKWSPNETDLIKIHLKKYLDNDSLYPSAAELVSFSNKYLTSERTVAQIKSKIQYLKRQAK